ncbi:MAG: DUF7619 domain-containing protein, partial [Flavobacteriales bacterium]
SVNNEPESHGLISYKITPLPNRLPGTVLENTAYIYFDNNEPIITNTTWTTIHECGGESEFSIDALIACGEGRFDLISEYNLIEEYSWLVDDDEIGSEDNSNYTISLPLPEDVEFTLIASNPLCEESSTVNYSTQDIETFFSCAADFNCDGLINSPDLLSFIGDFSCTGDCDKDLDNNGVMNTADLLIFLLLFGNECSV